MTAATPLGEAGLTVPGEAHWSRPFGFAMASAIPLTEYPAAEPASRPDLVLGLGPEAARAAARAGADPDGRFRRAGPDAAVARIDGVGAILVRRGREIGLTPETPELAEAARGHGPSLLRLVAMGSAMGMALHQRRLLVLHGATVVHPGGASVIVGPSGAGKSTLAAHLARSGLGLLGDDTMPVFMGASGPVVRRGATAIKLWEDALQGLGIDPEPLTPVAGRLAKRFLPVAEPETAEAPLAEVIELRPGAGAPRLSALDGLAALEVVVAHTYRPDYLDLLDWRERHFAEAARIAGAARILRLDAPREARGLAATVACLRGHWGLR